MVAVVWVSVRWLCGGKGFVRTGGNAALLTHARGIIRQSDRALGVCFARWGAGNMDIDSRVWLPSYLCTLQGGRREHGRHLRSEMEEVRRVLWGVALSPHCPRRNRDLLRQ